MELINFITLITAIFILSNCCHAMSVPPKPKCSDNETVILEAASYARRLIKSSTWGVVSTKAYNFNNVPFGNVLSFSDGGTGVPYFFLTRLDNTTANYTTADSGSSLTVGQFALGTCGISDPQEPTCGKVTLLGKLKPLKHNSPEQRFAQKALFTAHPRFNLVPIFGEFAFYKLDVSTIYVINDYSCPKFPSVDMYFNARF